jgi:hypothetical protein
MARRERGKPLRYPLATCFFLPSNKKGRQNADRRRSNRRADRARRALSGARTPVGVPPRLLLRRTNATAQLQPCFLGRGFDGRYPSSTYPSPARSAQAGHRAGRTVSEAARERSANPPAGTAPAPPHGLPPVGVPLESGIFAFNPMRRRLSNAVAELGTRCACKSLKQRLCCRETSGRNGFDTRYDLNRKSIRDRGKDSQKAIFARSFKCVALMERSVIRRKHARLKCRSRVSLRSTQATDQNV